MLFFPYYNGITFRQHRSLKSKLVKECRAALATKTIQGFEIRQIVLVLGGVTYELFSLMA